MVAKSPDEARAQSAEETKTVSKHRSSLETSFGGATPKYFVSFDQYGNTRILQQIVGGRPEQRFLVVGENGKKYQLVNGDTIVNQVLGYFKNNKEGLRKTLFDLGYMTERDYETRSNQALTSSILRVANEYTVDTVDSFRIDNKTKFPDFTTWLGGFRGIGNEDGPRKPQRNINLEDRDVIRELVKNVYMETNMQLPDDPTVIESKVDRYMDMIKKGTLTTYKEGGAEDQATTTPGFSQSRLQAELRAEIPKEQPIDFQKAKSLNFLTFLAGME
jgi:hypothetical protein